MEKNTILAVVLSTIVLIVFYVLQGVFFPRQQPVAQQPVISADQTPGITSEAKPSGADEMPQQVAAPSPAAAPQNVLSDSSSDISVPELEHIVIETELLEVTLTNAGGNAVSWKLKNHFEGYDDNVDMIFAGLNEAQAFSVAFGGADANPITSLFRVNRVSDYSVEFSGDFYNGDKKFTLIKRYDFKPHDYMWTAVIQYRILIFRAVLTPWLSVRRLVRNFKSSIIVMSLGSLTYLQTANLEK